MDAPLRNEVDIDQASLAAEAASIPLPDAAPAAGDQAAPGADVEGGPSPDQVKQFAEGAEPFVAGVLAAVHGMVAPNWTVTDERKLALTKSTALALAYWFPHEIPPKYVALIMVGGSLYGIVQDNRDPTTGELKPLQVPPKKADDAAAATS